MGLKPELAERIHSDLARFDLAKCAEKILLYIADRPYKSDFYVSLTDLVESSDCDKVSVERVVNYLTSSNVSRVFQRVYCYVDSDHVFHELDDEVLKTYQETRKLYHPTSGKEEATGSPIFMLYKTNAARVCE